jgi:hypothetical protein
MGEWVMNFRLCAVVFTFVFFAGQALAADDAAVLRAINQCAAIPDKDQRLACFDKIAPAAETGAPTPVFTPTPSSGASPQSATPANQQMTPEQFGSESLPAPEPKEGEPAPPGPIDSITANVTEYAYTPFGKFIVFLEGGEIWRQLDGDSGRATFRRNGDNSVVISRGILGSYNLQVNGSNAVFKVRRVK